jgi:hypothetical protein
MMFSTSVLASSKDVTNNQSNDYNAVNEYVNNLGYSDLPVDAVDLLKNSFTVNKSLSDWQVIVNYITLNSLPDGFKVIFNEDSVEISNLGETRNKTIINDSIIPMTTYTLVSKSYSPVYSHLYICSKLKLSAMQGDIYWIARYNTDYATGVHISCPENGVSIGKTYYDGVRGTTKTKSGDCCIDPVAGTWSMYILCNDPYGASLYGALMRQN